MSHARTVKRIFAIEGLNAQEKTPTATSRPSSISITLRELAAQGGIYISQALSTESCCNPKVQLAL
jgi:hypothetical protein